MLNSIAVTEEKTGDLVRVLTPQAKLLTRGAPHSAAMPAVALALRGLFAGAGSAMMSSSLVVDAVLELTGKADPRDVRLLYLGTLGTKYTA